MLPVTASPLIDLAVQGYKADRDVKYNTHVDTAQPFDHRSNIEYSGNQTAAPRVAQAMPDQVHVQVQRAAMKGPSTTLPPTRGLEIPNAPSVHDAATVWQHQAVRGERQITPHLQAKEQRLPPALHVPARDQRKTDSHSLRQVQPIGSKARQSVEHNAPVHESVAARAIHCVRPPPRELHSAVPESNESGPMSPEPPKETILDYPPEQLFDLKFNDVASQNFDVSPSHPHAHGHHEMMEWDTLEGNLLKARKLDWDEKVKFFATLTIDEWENAGNWFQEQFADTMKKMTAVRRTKRKLAADFEKEIKGRHDDVVRKRRATDAALQAMRESGGKVLESTPRKRTANVHA